MMHRIEKATAILSEIREDNSDAWTIIKRFSDKFDDRFKKKNQCAAVTNYFRLYGNQKQA